MIPRFDRGHAGTTASHEMRLIRTQSIDTPVEVERIQILRYREMGPLERLRAALALNSALEKLSLAGIRERDARLGRSGSPEDQRLRLFALRLGREEFVAAFGRTPESLDG